MDAARRRFLRGRFRDPLPQRPPWAVAAEAFEQRCTRCSACIEACPTRLIQPGEGGYPRVDFSHAECTFCADCVQACTPGALVRADDAPPWSLKARIGEGCLSARGIECRICGEACDAAAIRFRPTPGGVSRPTLNDDQCTGCGACVAPCPVDAVRVAKPMESER